MAEHRRAESTTGDVVVASGTVLERSPRKGLSEAELKAALVFAVEVAGVAGAVIRPHFRALASIENKLATTANRFDADLDGKPDATAGYDPVTIADRDAELAMRAALKKRYPEHGILGEEFGFRRGNGLTWVLDPIDGTRSFMTGFLHWGVLIGLFDGQSAVLGVMHQPVLDEFFYGNCTEAFYRKGNSGRETPLRTRPCATLSEAVVVTTHPDCFPDPNEWHAYQVLASECRMNRFGGDCYGYAMLAAGHLDLVVETGLNPYDIQALVPIIEGAGGVVTDWFGGDASLGGSVVAAGDRRAHEAALESIHQTLRGR